MGDIVRNHLYTVDMDKPLIRQNCGILLAEGDNNGDCFIFSLNRGGVELIPDGAASVTAYFIRSDGDTVFLTGESNGNRASVSLKQSCYVVNGRFSLIVKVSVSGQTATIAVIDGFVCSTQNGELIDPGEVVPSLDELFAQIEAMERGTKAANDAAAMANNATVGLVNVVNSKLREIAPPIINTVTGDGVITVTDSADRSLYGLKLYGRTTQDGTPSPAAPVPLVNAGNSGTITSGVMGKNLFYADITKPVAIKYTFDGTESTRKGYEIHLPPGVYALSVEKTNTANNDFMYGGILNKNGVRKESVNLVTNATIKEYTVTLNSGDYIVLYHGSAGVSDGSVISLFTKFPIQIEAGAVATDYEPYNSVGSVTVQTPDGLPGIPVSSGGNYTDASGRNWLCDEIDIGRGVYVQRVGVKNCDGTEDWKLRGVTGNEAYQFTLSGMGAAADGAVMANRFPATNSKEIISTSFDGEAIGVGSAAYYTGALIVRMAQSNFSGVDAALAEFKAMLAGNPMVAVYQLATPAETSLSDDVLTAYAAMKTLYPVSAVYNDAGAGMALSYIADTKNYIDQRIAALLNA